MNVGASSWPAWLLGPAAFTASDWLSLIAHFLALSLLAVGGALATAADMQRYVVGERHWLSAEQFTSGVALAQAAPGPNLIYVAVVGYYIAGLAGALATTLATLLPSTLLTLTVGRLGEQHQQKLAVRSFKAGLMPITLALLLAISWLLLQPVVATLRATSLVAAAMAVATVVVAMRTRLNPVWSIAVGAGLGALGLLG